MSPNNANLTEAPSCFQSQQYKAFPQFSPCLVHFLEPPKFRKVIAEKCVLPKNASYF